MNPYDDHARFTDSLFDENLQDETLEFESEIDFLFNAIKEVRPAAEANCGRAGQGKRTKDEIGIHAVRMGNIVGVHEVMIGTQNERITLKHEAFSRGVFAEGSLKAAAFLTGKTPGIYDMNDLLNNE